MTKGFIEKEYMELKSNESKCGCCGEVDCEFDDELSSKRREKREDVYFNQ